MRHIRPGTLVRVLDTCELPHARGSVARVHRAIQTTAALEVYIGVGSVPFYPDELEIIPQLGSATGYAPQHVRGSMLVNEIGRAIMDAERAARGGFEA